MTEPVNQPRSTTDIAAGVQGDRTSIRYSIGTLVRDRSQYDVMHSTFVEGGFSGPDCEYLFVDNTGAGQTSAYQGLNAILNAARGAYVILCHQDVRLVDDNRAVLDARLEELSRIDPNWGLAGNAGAVATGKFAIRISDPQLDNVREGNLPARVMSLDENFILVRRDARLGFSNDLSGFHFYGADICLNADMRGYTAYVVDFHLRHLSAGVPRPPGFYEAQQTFEAKWTRALRRRVMQTTCAQFRLKGSLDI